MKTLAPSGIDALYLGSHSRGQTISRRLSRFLFVNRFPFFFATTGKEILEEKQRFIGQGVFSFFCFFALLLFFQAHKSVVDSAEKKDQEKCNIEKYEKC